MPNSAIKYGSMKQMPQCFNCGHWQCLKTRTGSTMVIFLSRGRPEETDAEEVHYIIPKHDHVLKITELCNLRSLHFCHFMSHMFSVWYSCTCARFSAIANYRLHNFKCINHNVLFLRARPKGDNTNLRASPIILLPVSLHPTQKLASPVDKYHSKTSTHLSPVHLPSLGPDLWICLLNLSWIFLRSVIRWQFCLISVYHFTDRDFFRIQEEKVIASYTRCCG